MIALATVIGAAAVGVLAYLASRKATVVTNDHARYDQLQEDVDRERRERHTSEASFRAEITMLRIEMAGLRAEVRVRDDYIGQLRRHIDRREDPPPPPYPPELLHLVT